MYISEGGCTLLIDDRMASSIANNSANDIPMLLRLIWFFDFDICSNGSS